MQPALLDMEELIEDALSIHSSGLEKRRIKIQRNIPAGLPRIYGDRIQLIQIFINVIKNICEAFDVSEKLNERVLDMPIKG